MSIPRLRWSAKAPADVLDFAVDWSAVLAEAGGDAIAATTWTVPAPLAKGSEGVDGAVRTVWISGGNAGESYPVTCRIVTTGGRTVERTVMLDVLDL